MLVKNESISQVGDFVLPHGGFCPGAILSEEDYVRRIMSRGILSVSPGGMLYKYATGGMPFTFHKATDKCQCQLYTCTICR